jgi:hypothetical protein
VESWPGMLWNLHATWFAEPEAPALRADEFLIVEFFPLPFALQIY